MNNSDVRNVLSSVIRILLDPENKNAVNMYMNFDVRFESSLFNCLKTRLL